MDKRSLLFVALALALAVRCGNTLAGETGTDHRVAPGIHEVGDAELADMRGRYIVGDNTVLWFGVEMISTWQSSTGQTLRGTLTLGLDFSKNPNQPKVTFVPTVTITTLGNTLPSGTASNVNHSVQSAGLANVSGLTQSVQIAGDNNAAGNLASLNIQSGGNAPTTAGNAAQSPGSAGTASSNASVAISGSAVNASSSTSTSPSDSTASNGGSPSVASTTSNGVAGAYGRYATAGSASASSTYSGNGAQVNLSISGQGSVSQWIRPGSIGQTIALTTDNQVVTNQMIVSMVTQSMNGATSQLAHSLSQSLNLNHANR